MNEFPEFRNQAEYERYLTSVATLPEGFRTSSQAISFIPSERPTLEPYRMDLSLILADQPTHAFAGVFTKNAFPGAPVILARERMESESVQGILVNNKISNVRSPSGLQDARRLTAALGSSLGVPKERLLSVSTGIIGWALPVAEMESAIPELATSLERRDAVALASAIMTTDSFPKVRSVRVGEGTILGVAKGAGMIEPNMATMLVFLLTDIAIGRETLRSMLPGVVENSFNAISVDGDMSTSDMALVISSEAKPATSEDEFWDGLQQVCCGLARDIVRNGEGTGHVMQVAVTGLPDRALARGVAKAVVNSPLVKTAIFGNDPNVGRLLSAVGDHLGTYPTGPSGAAVDVERLSIKLGDANVYEGGMFSIDRQKEVQLSDYLKSRSLNPRIVGYPQHQQCVDIGFDFGGEGDATIVWGSDLSDQYVRVNADYRS